MLDYGWISKSNGEVVWQMKYNNTHTARSEYNRSDHPGNRRNIKIITLDPGTYTVHYQTNATHHYKDWNIAKIPEPLNMKKGILPSFPELWGIQLFLFDASTIDWIKQQIRTADQLVSGSSITNLYVDQEEQLWIANTGITPKDLVHPYPDKRFEQVP